MTPTAEDRMPRQRQSTAVGSTQTSPALRSHDMGKEMLFNVNEKSHTSDLSYSTSIAPSHREQFWDSWVPEIAALVFSIACTAAIAAILLVYNGKPVPKIVTGITLNAMIAILATASKSALLFSLSNSLGQLKWVWVRHDSARSLQDMETFDDASRGPFGASKMLFVHFTRSAASVGSILIIMCLLFDPFIQQVLIFDSHTTFSPSPDATLTKVQGLFSDGAGFEVTQAINAALWLDDFTISPSCPSSNCTWPVTQSVALVGECHIDNSWTLNDNCSASFSGSQDATQNCTATSGDDAIFDTNLALTLSQPCGLASSPGSMCGTTHELTVPDYSVVPVPAIYEEGQNCSSLPHGSCSKTTTPFLQYSILNWSLSEPGLQLGLNATRCSLDFHLQQNSTSVINGELMTDIVKQGTMIKTYQYHGVNNSQAYLYTCYDSPFEPPNDYSTFSQALYALNRSSIENNSTAALPVIYDITGQHSGFCMRAGTGFGFSLWPATISPYISIAHNATGTVTDWGSNSSQFLPLTYTSSSEVDSGALLPAALMTSISEIYYKVFEQLGPAKVTDNLAHSLTKMLHTPSLNTDSAYMDFWATQLTTFNGTSTISGQVGTSVILIEVRWIWLTMPIALSVGGIFFLLYTMYVTERSKSPLWKSSINALFYHGLDRFPETLPDLHTISDMDREASSTWIRLVPDEENVKVNSRLMLSMSSGRKTWSHKT